VNRARSGECERSTQQASDAYPAARLVLLGTSACRTVNNVASLATIRLIGDIKAALVGKPAVPLRLRLVMFSPLDRMYAIGITG
jgi:hypothetical protein